jgi:copper(I)-binding protein
VTFRRRSLFVVAPLALVLALATGCGSGFDATARQSYAPGDGVQAGSGDLRVVAALVVAPDESTSGVLQMAVVNNSDKDEEITAVDTNAGTADYTGSHVIPAGQTVVFGAGSDPSVTIRNLSAKQGETITVKVSFADAEPITLHTVVVPATGDYASITPAPEPTPTPSDTGGTPSGSVSPSPSSSTS